MTMGKHGRAGERPCPRGDSDCDCEPLYPGDVVEFVCIEHGTLQRVTVTQYELGHTYLATGATCHAGSVLLSTTQVRLVKL